MAWMLGLATPGPVGVAAFHVVPSWDVNVTASWWPGAGSTARSQRDVGVAAFQLGGLGDDAGQFLARLRRLDDRVDDA